MLQFNVSGLLKELVGATRSFDIDDDYEVAAGEAERITGHVDFLRTDRGVLVTGPLSITVWEVCGRCLQPFRQRLDLEVEEEFFPTVDVNTGASLPVDEDVAEGSFLISGQHILALEEMVRQYVIAQTPIKTLCREGCRGLCQTCGADLNKGDCACANRASDPRWNALTRLLNSGPS